MQNIEDYILRPEYLHYVDRVVIAGDLFECGMGFHDDDVNLVLQWMATILRRCKAYGVQLRVLNGTPSHDRGQGGKFVFVNDEWKIGADVKYYDAVAVELDEKHKLSFLYVPDEYRHSHAETYTECLEALSEAGLASVDHAYMHGHFEHQLPGHVDCHQSSNYLPIVSGFIFHGHDHRCSVYKDRILSQGSTDRLCFGEEGPKGAWLCYSSPQEQSCLFLINEGARIFKRCYLTTIDSDEMSAALNAMIDLPDGSYIEVVMTDPDNQRPHYNAFRKAYPQYKWSMNTSKELTDALAETQVRERAEFTPLNRNTLPGLFEKRLSQISADKATINHCLQKLEEAMHSIK